jgi:hypothetical protein
LALGVSYSRQHSRTKAVFACADNIILLAWRIRMSLGKGVCESGAGGVESVDWRVVKAVSVGVEESLLSCWYVSGSG